MELPILVNDKVLVSNSKLASSLYNKGTFGSFRNGKLELSLEEALYLLENKKLPVAERSGKKLDFASFVKRARKVNKDFWIRYCIFRDLRSLGYIPKTALKYGGDFRVYDKGTKPSKVHARWILFAAGEHSALPMAHFAAINRVAHSVKKNVLFAIVDDEDSVTYYETKWLSI